MQHCNSKVLLFGEHTVVNGGHALAIPFSHFRGSWKFTANDIDRDLAGFADYIDHHDYLFQIIAIDKFFADLDRGLIFESNIPMGYGLGSSGALVAAVYKTYKSTVEPVSAEELKKALAELENHFHGQSSGFDPLVCYLNQPVLTVNGSIKLSEPFPFSKENYQLFLINTNVSRSTGPIVESFQAYLSVANNQKQIDHQYKPLVDRAINSILASDYSQLYSDMESISGYQYAYLDFLIDDGSKKIWKEGLASDYFKLKICGAGQGGYLLGITSDIQKLLTNYPTREIIPIQ